MVTENKINYGIIIFGIHAGKNWNDIDRDYLSYIVSDECNTPAANKEIAQKVLDQYDLINNQYPLFKVEGRRYVE